jgi:hypothetical protein
VVGRGIASSSDTAIRVVEAERQQSHFKFRVVVPSVIVVDDVEGARVNLDGFLTRERGPGFPDIPTKTILVAIPPSVEPRLEVSPTGDSFRPGVIPAPVPREVGELDILARGESFTGQDRLSAPSRTQKVRKVYERAEAIYAGGGTFPERLAWLGETGVLRDQRYVEVHLAPVRFDPGGQGLRIANPFEVTVHFDGDTLSRAFPVAEKRFEGVYRATFANYDQGSAFRMSAVADDTSAAPMVARGPGGDGPGPLYRIRIRKDAVVRLDYATMSGTSLATVPLADWKVVNRGVEVPLHVRDDNADPFVDPTDGNGVLDPGEWVQFWGQALDYPKTELNTDFLQSDQDIYECRDYNEENVYFLSAEVGFRVRMDGANAQPTGGTPAAEFDAVVRAEEDDVWLPFGGADPWNDQPAMSNPVVGSLTIDRDETIDLPGLATDTTARVLVRLRGLSDDVDNPGDHPLQITLGTDLGTPLGSDSSGSAFDGRSIYTHDFTWNHSSGATLTDPARVRIEAQLFSGTPGYRNQVMLDWIEVHYKRGFGAIGDLLIFDWPNESRRIEITGIDSHDPEVYEITNLVAGSEVVETVRLESVDVLPNTPSTPPYTASFRIREDTALPLGATRTFVVAGTGAVQIPSGPDFEEDTVSDLRDNSIQADIIVIAHPDVMTDPVACTSPSLTALLGHRAAQGLTSRVACLEDVEDDFNFGLEGPLAIKNFLRWVTSTVQGEGWADPKPSYVLLLGDASYDTRGGPASFNYIPTQIMFRDRIQLGYYASDNLMAAVSGDDQLADLVIGRIASSDPTSTNTVLDKILDYETMTPPGNWTRHAVFISDRGKRDSTGDVNGTESLEFETTSALGESFMKIPPHTALQLRYWSDFCDTQAPPPQPCNIEAMRSAIKDAINGVDGNSDGAAVVQYSGHGNFEVWSDDAYLDERDPPHLRDTLDFNNGLRMPLMMAHNCLTGGFHTLLDHSVGEDWLFRQGGGAVAVFSPSGLSFNFLGSAATGFVWDQIYGSLKERELGVVVMGTLAGLCGQNSIEGCQNYILQGDPATQLAIPSVDPPTGVQAVAGNGFVDLSWTASAGGATSYDVYRTSSLLAPYDRIANVLSPNTTYRDEDARNTFTYYYYVVALDGEGFESPWSNFNSQCDTGPDCVIATPLNPDPPAIPTGLDAVDPETGARLDIVWTTNPEDDIQRYTVHYGTESGAQSGIYEFSTDATALATALTLGSLQNGTTYYIAITATNTSGNTSPHSQEVTAVPTLVLGVRPPRFINDLHIGKDGTGAELTWTEVTEDIYGKPESVELYEIFRDTVPDFIPSPANKIHECISPCSGYTDPNALAAGPSYHYLVRARDFDGNTGGAGRELPAGIVGLAVGRSDTMVNLSWPAVSTVFNPGGAGEPTTISYYEIFASDQPLSRGALDAEIPAATTTETSADLTLPVDHRYYSVLAVDTRGNKSPF